MCCDFLSTFFTKCTRTFLQTEAGVGASLQTPNHFPLTCRINCGAVDTPCHHTSHSLATQFHIHRCEKSQTSRASCDTDLLDTSAGWTFSVKSSLWGGDCCKLIVVYETLHIISTLGNCLPLPISTTRSESYRTTDLMSCSRTHQ